MKFIYTIILAVVCALSASNQSASAQIVLFSEDFTTEANKVVLTLPWERVNTPLVSPLSGGHYLQTGVPNNPGNSTNIYTITFEVNSVNYKDLTLTWQEKHLDGTQGNNVPDIRSLLYRIGGAGVFLPLTSVVSSTLATWEGITIPLGTIANNIERFELRMLIERPNGSTRRFAIDDIAVLGTFVDPIIGAPLPVELASFRGQVSQGVANLAWATATEKNNDKFVVERSQDGKTFSQVGEVKGSGASAIKLYYNFTDKAPTGGVNYYRLRQIDTDGTTSFSNVIAMEVAVGMAVSIYPTLATSAVTISLQNASGNATINVVDITGRAVATFNSTTLREIRLPVQNFKSGLYFVRVTDGQNQQVQRFIKE